MRYIHSLAAVRSTYAPFPARLMGFWDGVRSSQSGLCWTLSRERLKQWKRQEDSNVFYGDEDGLRFIKHLGLSYDEEVLLPASILERAPTRVWSFGKMYVMSQQESPFLHLDGDVFWTQPPDAQWLASPFVTQNEEYTDAEKGWSWFYGMFALLHRAGVRDPLMDLVWDVIHSEECRGSSNVFNFGVVGGTSPHIADVCRVVVDFLLKHSAIIDSASGKLFPAVAFEQQWIPLLLRARGVTPVNLLPERQPELTRKANEIGFCHFLAANKEHAGHLKLVRNRLKELNPDAPVLRGEPDIVFEKFYAKPTTNTDGDNNTNPAAAS